jgi:hypothetical protein
VKKIPFGFFNLKKMLNTQNQTLVTIACVHISVVAPIPMVMHKGLEPI